MTQPECRCSVKLLHSGHSKRCYLYGKRWVWVDSETLTLGTGRKARVPGPPHSYFVQDWALIIRKLGGSFEYRALERGDIDEAIQNLREIISLAERSIATLEEAAKEKSANPTGG